MKKNTSHAEKKKVKEELSGGRVAVGDIDWKADLFWATQDLYNIEKHMYYTIGMLFVGKDSIWCISKHLLGAFGQGFEVATKLFHMGNEKLATMFVNDSMTLHDIFFGLTELSKKDKETKFKVYVNILKEVRLMRARWLKVLKGEKVEEV